ncbi:MotA/TolQ/ExbB proton channel family protein [Singulisphaera sp. PoT]|uniref:MotA/TolQ/ExbB proton channel family protein n=1 Tax=Singulisphaera sp. PoT TaxID=3411797 RepID=UPI003BF4945C
MTDRIAEILFTATGILLAPVLVLLMLLSAAAIWMVGGLLGEALDRRRGRVEWKDLLAHLKEENGPSSNREPLPTDIPARFREVVRLAGRSPVGARKALDDLELTLDRRLSVLSFATRVGPMLGLIGTLLPLGPALRGLASDDLAALAGDLEIAFTSTVFGLLVGGAAYAAGIVRRNWYDQDVADLEFVLDAVAPPTHDKATSTSGDVARESAHA